MAKKQFFRHRFLAILVLFENPDKKKSTNYQRDSTLRHYFLNAS